MIREILQRNKVSILLFHDVDAESGEKSFDYLKRKYNIIDLNDYIDALYADEKPKLPKKALIITFDDGHIRNYELLPVFKKHQIPVTIFVCASIVNTNRHFWFKFSSQDDVKSGLKQKSNTERLHDLSLLGFEQTKEYAELQALQMHHIEQMKDFVNFQSHTCFHPILPKCADKEAWIEINRSKEILENEYAFKINAISYPNGDYADRDIRFSRQSGYKCGISCDLGFNDLKTDPFRLKRFGVNDTGNINELVVKACGLWPFLRTLNGRFQEYGYSKSSTF